MICRWQHKRNSTLLFLDYNLLIGRCFARGVFFLAIFSVLSSCLQNPDAHDVGVEISRLSVSDAESCFKEELKAISSAGVSLSEIQGLVPGGFAPEWNKAKLSEDLFIEAVNVPIRSQYSHFLRIEYYNELAGGFRKYVTPVYQRLIVTRIKRTGENSCLILSLAPARSYFKEGWQESIAGVLSGDFYDFDGLALYTSIGSGTILRVDDYQDGVQLSSANLLDPQVDPEAEANKMQMLLRGVEYRTLGRFQTRGGGYCGNYNPIYDGGGYGGGGGGISPPPPPPPPPPPLPEEPCNAQAQQNRNAVNNIINDFYNATDEQIMNTPYFDINDYKATVNANYGKEVSATLRDYGNYGCRLSDINIGNSNSVVINVVDSATGVIHNHPPGTIPHPSATDIFVLSSYAEDGYNCSTSIIYIPGSDSYALYIENTQDAADFWVQYSDQEDKTTHGFVLGGSIDIFYRETLAEAQSLNMSDPEAYALSAVLNYFDSGIQLLKFNFDLPESSVSQFVVEYNSSGDYNFSVCQ